MKSIFERVVPFIFFGVMLVVLTLGILLLSYILILGAIVGLVLFLIARIKEKLFPSKQMLRRKGQCEKQGRIINHDDHK